jgi:hypothetical protein
MATDGQDESIEDEADPVGTRERSGEVSAREADSVTKATFLPRYLQVLDGSSPLDVLPMLAEGFRFTVLWNADGGARDFSGGRDEFRGYMRQRDPDGQLHHILLSSRNGDTEVVVGWTSRRGAPLATYMMSARLDADELATQLFAARTTSLVRDEAS